MFKSNQVSELELERKRKNAELYGIDITKKAKVMKPEPKNRKSVVENKMTNKPVEPEWTVNDCSSKYRSSRFIINEASLSYFEVKWKGLLNQFENILLHSQCE